MASLEQKLRGLVLFLTGAFKKPVVAVAFLLSACVLENIFLAQHARTYTFDIIKLVALVAFVSGYIATSTSFSKTWILTLTIFGAVISMADFSERYIYGTWAYWDKVPYSYQKDIGKIIESTSSPATELFATSQIKPGLMFYSRRNLVPDVQTLAADEGLNIESYIVRQLLKNGAGEGIVYFTSDLELDRQIWVQTIYLGKSSVWKKYNVGSSRFD